LDQARTIRIVAGVSAWPPSTRAWRPRCAPTISDGPRPRASARQEPAGFVVAKPAAARARARMARRLQPGGAGVPSWRQPAVRRRGAMAVRAVRVQSGAASPRL